MARLEPCPFCGGEGQLYVYPNHITTEYNVQCLGCGASSRYSNSEIDVIEAWNRRMENENTKSCNDEYKS